MRAHLLLLSLVLACPGLGTAQVVGPWRAWEYSRPNMVAGGYGPNAGIEGGRYARVLGGSPVAVGVGAGRYGVAPFVEVGLESVWLNASENYVSLGLLVGWAPGTRQSGTLLFELGERVWFARDRVFVDVGLGLMSAVWGKPTWQFWGSAFPRAQVGVAF